MIKIVAGQILMKMDPSSTYFQTVLGIRDIWCGSGSVHLTKMDPDPDPTPFFSDFKDAKNYFFSYFFLKHLISC